MIPKLLMRAPVLTASGYGVHSRQILKALIASGNFDISIDSINWGQTPFLMDRDPFTDHIRSLIEKREIESRENVQYDISVQVTIPNEFKKLANVNIGVTAGIEVDRASPEWIIKCNENVDLVVVPSEHSARTLAEIQYQDENGNTIRLTKPVLIAPEGVDSRYFNTTPVNSDDLDGFNFPASFNFLAVGLGFDKGLGEDRKNLSNLVKWFCERFKDDKTVGLVLKVGIVGNSLMDFEMTKRRISELKKLAGCGEFPRIHLVHGRLSDQKMAALYKHPNVKAFITTTHGEGFGLPIIEAAACGLPVLATNWSGHLDFLHVDGKKKFIPLEFKMGQVPQSMIWPGVIEQGTNWANVSEDDVKFKMKKVVASYEKPSEWAKELAAHIASRYNLEKISYELIGNLASFLNQRKANPRTPHEAATILKERLGIVDGDKTLLYTMPMSAGDVFISTAVVDSLRKKFPEHKIFFATDRKYFDILKDNDDIDKIIQWENWMADVPLCEMVFSDVYTPNLAIQTTSSNWVRGGKGRLLGNEIAAQCLVDFGDYFIHGEAVSGLPEQYVVVHPGSGKGQWEARNYNHWNDVIQNLRRMLTVPVVLVGSEGDMSFEGVIDLRGKTNYNQLAWVIRKANCLVGIDSVSMHMAAAFGVNHVSLFGSSYSTSTGPVVKNGALSILLDSKTRYGCEKACYKYQCTVDRENPCINEIPPTLVLLSVQKLVGQDVVSKEYNYKEFCPKIYGYTHVLNPESQGFPYIESIKSMLGFCEEVVVVDGGSNDGSLEKIKSLGDRVKVINREWDWTEPGMDGMQKAFGRALCSAGDNDFLWQQDADEVVHENDYQKIKELVKKFPKDVDLLHLPVVELWGSGNRVRTDRHSWKWRISRNNFRITHGINKDARVLDEKTGKMYARKGMSDGCEYVDIMTGEYVQHKGFYTRELELLRTKNPKAYGETMNKVFNDLPCVFHYSWANLDRKVRNFRDFWDKCWSNLYNEPTPTRRFDVQTDEDVKNVAAKLLAQGGEHTSAQTFELKRSNPSVMDEWLSKISYDHGHLHNNKESTGASSQVS